jgi:hypothetical protein
MTSHLSIFYLDKMSGIQLKISQRWSYTLAIFLYKMTKLMGYKYTMRPLEQIFIIFILCYIYIYFQSIFFLEYYYIFSL